jgi:ubiquinol oxidase
MRIFADQFFAKRYGHRAVVLETIAAVPGMAGAMLQHLRSLRHIRDDQGWIRELLEEVDNERMHLMTFIHIAQPTVVERGLIMISQGIFFNVYFFFYLFASRTGLWGTWGRGAVVSYTQCLAQLDAGLIENVPAPQIAKDYRSLSGDARLHEVIIAVRAE